VASIRGSLTYLCHVACPGHTADQQNVSWAYHRRNDAISIIEGVGHQACVSVILMI
jgi:hypothetical protein